MNKFLERTLWLRFREKTKPKNKVISDQWGDGRDTSGISVVLLVFTLFLFCFFLVLVFLFWFSALVLVFPLGLKSLVSWFGLF